MKGKIAFANRNRSRYAVLTDDGDYTLFELPQSADVAVGDLVTGNLNAVGSADFSIGGSSDVSVVVENCHCLPAMARQWVAGWDLATFDVWLAEGADGPVAYAVLEGDWLHSLYVLPEAAGQGVGSALLDLAKSLRPGGFCLWVFESNQPARDFYRQHGLLALERTDGKGNEEQAPDIRMAWPGAEPLAFYRGLIDEVDAELGDLLARRAALTRVVQQYKAAGPQPPPRDPDREDEIVAALAHRAPELGPERLRRIVHAIITESLEAARDGSQRA